MEAKMPRTTAVVGATLLLAMLVGRPLAAAPTVGKAAPGFALRDGEGALVTLSDLAYKGRVKPRRPKQVVLLDFFRTDCKPCRKGLPKLVKLHQKLKGKPVRFLLIAMLEEEEGEAKLRRFLRKNPLPFPVLMDAYAVAAKKYVYVSKGNKSSVQIPAIYVIDKGGIVRGRFKGVDEKEHTELETLVESLAR